MARQLQRPQQELGLVCHELDYSGLFDVAFGASARAAAAAGSFLFRWLRASTAGNRAACSEHFAQKSVDIGSEVVSWIAVGLLGPAVDEPIACLAATVSEVTHKERHGSCRPVKFCNLNAE